jgi:hypothetical protein
MLSGWRRNSWAALLAGSAISDEFAQQFRFAFKDKLDALAPKIAISLEPIYWETRHPVKLQFKE